MKITRNKLRKLIYETILREQQQLSTAGARLLPVTGLVAHPDNSDAIEIADYDIPKYAKLLRITSRYKNGPFYVWKDSKFSGALRDTVDPTTYQLGLLGNIGDPFTYNSVGGDRYRVISGPLPETIGKIFTLEPPLPEPLPEPDEETLDSLSSTDEEIPGTSLTPDEMDSAQTLTGYNSNPYEFRDYIRREINKLSESTQKTLLINLVNRALNTTTNEELRTKIIPILNELDVVERSQIMRALREEAWKAHVESLGLQW